MDQPIKRIDIKEFREFGYLQEVNRQFFHPLGLALEVVIDEETGEESLGGVWDYRDSPDGIRYTGLDLVPKMERVRDEWNVRIASRMESLGYMIQEPGDA